MEQEYLTVTLFKNNELKYNLDITHLREILLKKALETKNEKIIKAIKDYGNVDLKDSGDFLKFLIRVNKEITDKGLQDLIDMVTEVVEVDDCCSFLPF